MILPILVAFGLLDFTQSLENQDVDLTDIIIDRRVIGVLGQDVYLQCLYSGTQKISDSSWKRLDSRNRAKVMAGYRSGKPFAKDSFSTPASTTNLTVKVTLNSLELEGNYTCVFTSDEDEMMDRMFLRIIARPQVNTYVVEEVLNGTHYQNIFCSASYAKPSASLHWDIHGAPPSEDIFSIHNITSILPNATVSIISILRFPIHLNNESTVACVIQHQALTEPSVTVVKLQTFVSPIVTMDVALIEKEENSFFEVFCQAKGGRPHPSILWIQPDSGDIQCSANVITFDLVSSYCCFSLDGYEGKNITCIFGYPNLPAIERTVTLPTYPPIHVTLLTNTTRVNGIKYTEVKCVADNVSPGANITWGTENCRDGISAPKAGNVVSGGQEEHSMVWNTALLPVNFYAGCTIICLVHHAGLKTPVQKSIHIPLIGPPRSYVKVGLQKDSTHWAAVCEYRSDGDLANISWIISDTDTATPLTINTTKEGSKVLVTCIYKFKRCQHEGKFLTCVIQNEYGEVKRRIIHVPNFFISSIEVLNKTILLHGSHGQHTGVHRVTLKEHISNQKIIFKVNGNASECDIKCFRSDGLSASTDGMALVFAQQLSESDAGLYTCRASWYKHNATVTVLVEVTSQEMHNMMLILICLSSAFAIILMLMVILCIFCKKNEEAHSQMKNWKKHESLSALVQDPCSPELKKARGQGQEYAELVHYSIVIDMKSTV